MSTKLFPRGLWVWVTTKTTTVGIHARSAVRVHTTMFALGSTTATESPVMVLGANADVGIELDYGAHFLTILSSDGKYHPEDVDLDLKPGAVPIPARTEGDPIPPPPPPPTPVKT